MSHHRDLESILDIANYGDRAVSFVVGLTQVDFEEDDKMIARQLLIRRSL